MKMKPQKSIMKRSKALNMKKIFFVAFYIFSFYLGNIFAVGDSYTQIQRDFIIGDINTKEKIIINAAGTDKREFIPVYLEALNFIEDHYEIFENNEQFLKIGTMAIHKLGILNEKKALKDIRYLFSAVDNDELKIVCLNALVSLIEKDADFIAYLNTKYEEGLSDLIQGKIFNIGLLIAYSNGLGKFADASSFDLLFKTLFYPVDESLKEAVTKALKNIFFDYSVEILKRMNQKDIQYIKTLYALSKENKQISNQKLGEISEAVLTFAIENLEQNPEEAKILILETLPVLSDLKWNRASKNINSFFYTAQTAWQASAFSTADLIKIINCMGNMGTLETAQNLSIFLGVLNSQTEKTSQYNEELVLSLIKAIGKLGSKTAFDYLLFVEYLSYSETIKVQARKAIEELKW